MSTLFEPSLSTSTRPLPPQSSPSVADTLPPLPFNFDSLRDTMSRFTTTFDSFIATGRKRVLEERNTFRLSVAELTEDQRMKKKDIEILAHKASTHAQAVSKEVQETQEMQAAIAEITGQRDARAAQRDRLRAEIRATQKAIQQRVAAQEAHAAALDAQARFNKPELQFWTDYLCLRIEGAGQADRLKFVFTHVDERDWEREGWFELDIERRDYRVVCMKPKLEGEEVERCLERVNENRDLGMFLRGMRDLFVAAMKN